MVEVTSAGRGFANYTGSASTSTAQSTAVGLTGTRSVFGGTPTHVYEFRYTPRTDADNWSPSVGTALGNGLFATGAVGGGSGKYNVYVTWPNSTNIDNAGTTISVEHDDGAGGITQTIITDVNQNNVAPHNANFPGVNKWWRVATDVPLTAGSTYKVVSTPNSFTFVSQRFSGVFWEFVPASQDPCVNTLPVTVNGPVGAGQTTVDVAGVNNATKVSVYMDSGSGMTKIGELTSGVVNGVNTVPVSALVKNAKVAATQTVSGQEGCVPNDGVLVGGGPNTRLRVALSVREDVTLAGPIGASGTSSSSRILFVGPTILNAGGGPGDGKVIFPSNTWQTITFTRGEDPNAPVDPTKRWNGAGNDVLSGDFGILEGFSFAIDNLTDNGPYQMYFDNLKNGDTVIHDWESSTNGTLVAGFREPLFSGTTASHLLSLPNVSVVTNGTADTGTNSLRMFFQFKDTNSARWVRITTSGAAVVSNPMIDLRLPITMRVLLLPVGAPLPPPPGGAPTLGFSHAGSTLTLTWTDGAAALQQATTLTGQETDWSNVAGATSPFNVSTASGSAKYFRLKK